MNKWIKWTFAALVALLLLGALLAALRPSPLQVDVATVETRPFQVTVNAQGRTRAHQPFVVSAPVAGQLQRSALIEGQRVQQGEVLAQIALAPENPRNEAAIRANLAAAQAREESAQAAIRDAESAANRATREASRRDQLFRQGLIGEEERDSFRQAAEAADAHLLNARAALSAARADIDMARALLVGIDAEFEALVAVTSPVDGTVHRVHERSSRVLQAGEALLTLSNEDALELVIDLLTREAVQVNPGDRILISDWGGEQTLQGRVRHIEPEAFTKISALGVEEQRVNVIGELDQRPTSLGAEYRIEAAIVVREESAELTVPNHALFRRGGAWHTFVISDGVARLREVAVGARGGEYFQVLDGLQAGEQVILFPSDQIADGVAVVAR